MPANKAPAGRHCFTYIIGIYRLSQRPYSAPARCHHSWLPVASCQVQGVTAQCHWGATLLVPHCCWQLAV